jgi:hypothetical protein
MKKKIASIFDYTLIKHGGKERKAPDWKKHKMSERSFFCAAWLCIKNLISTEQCNAVIKEIQKRKAAL